VPLSFNIEMIFYKYFIFGFSVIYIIHAISSLSHLQRNNAKLVWSNIGMSLLSALNGLVSFFALEIPVIGHYKSLFFDMAIFSGATAFYFYLASIKEYLDLHDKLFKFLRYATIFLTIPFYLDFLFVVLTKTSFMTTVQSGISPNIYFAKVGINIMPKPWAGFSLFLINLFLIIAVTKIWRILKGKEPWLKLGIVFTLLVAINDSLMPSPMGAFLLPLYFLSNIVEATRFSHLIRVNAYQKIGRLEGELERASRAAEISYIAGSIAHDIKNPLTVILGKLEMLKRKTNEKDLVDKITINGKKINKIIDTYLNLLRSNKDDKRGIYNLKNIIVDSIETCESKIRIHNIQVENLIPDDIYIECNNIKIEMSLVNLISNACDANSGKDSAWIKIKAYHEGEKFLILVMDSGDGIPEDIQKSMFQKQFTTKNYSKGTGLGLDIVKQFLEEHGFSISYQDDYANTCFAISVPLKSLVEKEPS
jgi:signal transduction histidine kinase